MPHQILLAQSDYGRKINYDGPKFLQYFWWAGILENKSVAV